MTTPLDSRKLQSALGDRFRIDRQIAQGGQATVFLAHPTNHSSSNTTELVALKVCKAGLHDDRVDREIEALRGFEHPCLSKFLENGIALVEGETLKYVAWVFVQGTDLRHLLNQGPLSARIAAVVGRDVSRALEHLWFKRIVHRDVNPRNVILRDDGVGAVLIDLGVARFLDRTTITPAGMTWGTMGYLSPEQWHGDNLSCLSDVFSLGICLQELLSGRHPTNGDQSALMRSAQKTSRLAPLAPAALADLIDRCLAARAAFRPLPSELVSSFASIAAELR